MSSRRVFMAQAASALVWNATKTRVTQAQAARFSFASAAAGSGWCERPMRWAQLAFVEDDPGRYDPQFWLDYFQSIHADAACLSAGGIVAFYPTDIPLHYRSKWLGKRDSFGDLMAGCRKLKMNILARTDSHACHQDVYEAHPDWIAVDEHGNKMRHPSDRALWLTCVLGPYSFIFMDSVHREIMQRYMPDGIFTNRWAGTGMCYCEHCRESFRTYSGLELPTTSDPQDPSRKAYVQWHSKVLFEIWNTWNATIRAINPNASYIANAGGGALSELDMKHIGELAPTLFADRQGRSGLMPPWANGKNGKEYRATMGNKAVGGIFSVGVEERYRWKDSVQSGDEIMLWVADGIAHGLRPWFTKFNAKPLDTRWLPVVKEVYTWHHANESYLRNERSLARVAMVYSQQTATFYGGPAARAKVEDPSLGYYQALVEARIPFDMVHDRLFDEEHLRPYKTLILPNIAALSDRQCDQLRAFVENGGGLVATFETSLFDEWGVGRKDFGLAQLFGASFTGVSDAGMLNSYLRFNPAGDAAPELLFGFDTATRIINAASQTRVATQRPGYRPAVSIVPSYPDLPMEEVFQKDDAVAGPGLFTSHHGAGRVAYFPGDIDRTFWETLNVDQGRLLVNAVRWATNEETPVTVEGKGFLDISIWRQKGSLTVHLVNLTNPMAMKGPIRELIPSPPQRVKLRLPAGEHLRRVRLLRSERDVPYSLRNGVLRVQVPPVELHEIVAIDLL